MHVPNTSARTYGALAVDAKSNLWLADWSSRRVVHFDTKTGKALRTLTYGSIGQPLGIMMDGRGKVLVTVRFTTGTAPSQVYRYHPTTYVLEQVTGTGNSPGRACRLSTVDCRLSTRGSAASAVYMPRRSEAEPR